MQLYATITENVNQCGISLVDFSDYLLGTKSIGDIADCKFPATTEDTIQIPVNPFFSIMDTGDLDLLNMCSGRSNESYI